jgi:hypothetical protein
MNHRRSAVAVAVLAAAALAACGEVDDAKPTPSTNAPVSIVQAERAALAEAQAQADVLDAWQYYYRVTHPAPKSADPVSANQAEHRANFEARLAEAAAEAAARGPVSANQAEHRAMVEVTVEHEELRRGVDIKR